MVDVRAFEDGGAREPVGARSLDGLPNVTELSLIHTSVEKLPGLSTIRVLTLEGNSALQIEKLPPFLRELDLKDTAVPKGLESQDSLLNLNVSWNDVLGQPFDLGFFMSNVTNKIYPTVVNGSWNSAGFESYQYAPPRQWGFRLKYKFGQ